MTLRFGYKASAEQFGPRELLDLCVLAEGVGLDSVWVSDHFQPWRHHGGHAPYSLSWLAAAGERTSRVSLGTSVLTPTFRHNPAMVAQAFGTLGALFPGRVALGVGTGEALNEVAVADVVWPPFKERLGRLREAIELIRLLWAGERVTFQGEYFRTTDAAVYDRPTEPIPVYVAAGGPVVAAFAGRTGDGFICTSGKGAELYTDKLLPAVRQGAAESGRTLDDLDRMIEIKLSYDPDPAAALENTRFWAPLSLTAEQKAGLHDPVEMERAADALRFEEVARRWIVSANPDEAVAAIRTYVDYGFNHLVFHAPGHDQVRFLTSFAEQVLPRLRALEDAQPN
jgi:coenzyme F420-dependent glucose-6-phosphate dehydrogenase